MVKNETATTSTTATTATTVCAKIQSKQDMLMGSLKEFFSVPEHLGKMIPILTQKSKISLRLLDWFVTNYAKKKNISYFFDVPSKNGSTKQQYFNVFLKYKSQLKAYSKQQFDPFCRKWKIVKKKKIYCGIHFYYKKDHYVETTVGQLNFFKWIIANKVLDYAIEYLTEIQRDMLKSATKKRGSSTKSKTVNPKTEKSKTEKSKTENTKNTKKSNAPQVTKPVSQTTQMATTNKNDKGVFINATKKLTKKHVSITVDFS